MIDGEMGAVVTMVVTIHAMTDITQVCINYLMEALILLCKSLRLVISNIYGCTLPSVSIISLQGMAHMAKLYDCKQAFMGFMY